ncbi:hypothetical protein [Anaerosphaera multitolerans]|uniref:hypothetical protein n=1 Tax=Anaerosphaera multitolerans TaxID=2487351 RepID=UPI0013E2BBAB|nr:hypothetical protein [Anaerosphaera multitolerans]
MKYLKIIVGILLILGGLKEILNNGVVTGITLILIGALLIKTYNSAPPKKKDKN